jgi:hypothetical protein
MGNHAAICIVLAQVVASTALLQVWPALAITGHTADSVQLQSVRLPETGYVVVPRSIQFRPIADQSAHDMVAALMGWIAATSDLPATTVLPNIVFAPPAIIAAMGNVSVGATHRQIGTIPQQREIISLYDNAARTIYLPDSWTGSTGTDLSVLVHELVHHLQNIAGLRFACPQERERLAYQLQERWLNLFGTSLESEFEIDGFTLLVVTNCAY